MKILSAPEGDLESAGRSEWSRFRAPLGKPKAKELASQQAELLKLSYMERPLCRGANKRWAGVGGAVNTAE